RPILSRRGAAAGRARPLMHPRPQHARATRRRPGRGWLLALALLGGCNTLRLQTAAPPAEAAAKDKAERPAVTSLVSAALPSKYSQRVSQYYFVADFDLQPYQAQFQELADLREQII